MSFEWNIGSNTYSPPIINAPLEKWGMAAKYVADGISLTGLAYSQFLESEVDEEEPELASIAKASATQAEEHWKRYLFEVELSAGVDFIAAINSAVNTPAPRLNGDTADCWHRLAIYICRTIANQICTVDLVPTITDSLLIFQSDAFDVLYSNAVLECHRCNQASNSPLSEETPLEEKVVHSEDFRSVRWHDGKQYTFTKTQALVFKCLWEHWEKGKLSVSDEKLIAVCGTTKIVLGEVFRVNGVVNPAWGTVIIEGDKKGLRRLNFPEKHEKT